MDTVKSLDDRKGLPIGHESSAHIRASAAELGISLTEFSDDEIRAGYYRFQSVYGLDQGLHRFDTLKFIRIQAEAIRTRREIHSMSDKL
jgi:hypothetical protein